MTRTDRHALVALGIGVGIRLLAVPFSAANEADAVTRVFIALGWLDDPTFITHGGWGPLHTYLLAAALWLWPDPVHAPVVLTAALSAAVAVPLYLFVKHEWSESAGLFVTCLYLAYPVAVRFGLVALSEVPFIFFVALALCLLSRARDDGAHWGFALAAGLAVTLAGALRYEAWGLTPLLALLLWPRRHALAAFLFSASLFPLMWMTGSYVHSGDALYSFTWSADWNLNVSALNAHLTTLDLLNRVTYFPRALFFGLTPLAFLVCLSGVVSVLREWRPQRVWLLPPLALFVAFTLGAVNGKMTIQVRYSLSLAILLIPFAAEWFESIGRRHRRLLATLVVLSMLPLSYVRSFVPWPSRYPNPIPGKVSALPRVAPEVRHLSQRQIEQATRHPEGLLLDFWDWGETYYVALMSRKPPASVFIMPGEVNQPLDTALLRQFLGRNPTGLLLLSEKPRLLRLSAEGGEGSLSIPGIDTTLTVREIDRGGSIRLFAYSVAISR